MDYSAIIKKVRETLLVSQADLATMLGVTFATVNRWENGHHSPSLKQQRALRNLCKTRHISLEDK